jgi:hypothetical protein
MYNVGVNKKLEFSMRSCNVVSGSSLIGVLPQQTIEFLAMEENMNLFEKYNIKFPQSHEVQPSRTNSKKKALNKGGVVSPSSSSPPPIISSIQRNVTLYVVTSRITSFKHQLENEEMDSDQEEEMDVNLKNTITISKFNYCALQDWVYPGAYYAFLLSHPLKNKKKDTTIGFCKDPIRILYLLNGQYVINKNTSSAAPYWILDIILGVFPTKEKASYCCKEWVSETRGQKSKREKSEKLFKQFKVNRYSRQIQLKDSFDLFLCNINAPKKYIDKARELMITSR